MSAPGVPQREDLNALRARAHTVEYEEVDAAEHEPAHVRTTRPQHAGVGILGKMNKRAIEFLDQ